MIYQHLSTSTLQTNPSQLGNVKHQFAFSLKQFHRSQLSAIWVRDTDQAGDLGTVPQLRSDTAHGSGVCNISLQRQIYTSQASPGQTHGQSRGCCFVLQSSLNCVCFRHLLQIRAAMAGSQPGPMFIKEEIKDQDEAENWDEAAAWT